MCVPFESTVILNLAEEILKSFKPYLSQLVFKVIFLQIESIDSFNFQLIEGKELIETELHEQLCQRLENPVDDLEPELLEEEAVLDFTSCENPELSNNENLLEEFHPPHITPEENIVITSQYVETNQFTDFFETKYRPPPNTVEVIDLTDSEVCSNILRERNSNEIRNTYLSQDLFELENRPKRKSCQETFDTLFKRI